MNSTNVPINKLNYFLFILFLCSACSKKEGETTSTDGRDVTPPVVTILKPTNNQVFTNGQTIQISASASDNERLSQLEIHVIDKHSGALLRDIHAYPGAKTGNTEDAFTARASVNYIIKVIAYDARSNQTITQVEVSAN